MTNYETDFYTWLQQQAEFIRNGQIDKLDLPNIAEELESLARNERYKLGEHIQAVMRCLIKWKFRLDARDRECLGELVGQRADIERLLETSPSLSEDLPSIIAQEWKWGRKIFALETGWPKERIPEQC